MNNSIDIRTLPGKTAFALLIKTWIAVRMTQRFHGNEKRDTAIQANVRRKDIGWLSILVELFGGTMFRQESADQKDMINISIYPKRV